MAGSDSVAVTLELDEMMTSFAEAHPDFVAELQALGVTVEEYQRMLEENRPVVITSNSSSPEAL